MNRRKLSRLPVDVGEALRAIATTGKGRCWHCDVRLPEANAAIGRGWDVQRIGELPVANIILVCPECVRHESKQCESALDVKRVPAVRVHAAIQQRSGRRALELNPRRA
jgi:hypothetical protein